MALSLPGLAQAIIITPDSVTSDGNTVTTADNLINGSGLSGAGSILSQTHSDTFGSGGGTNWKGSASNAFPLPVTLTFAFSNTSLLDQIHLWNYSDPFGFRVARDVTRFNLALSADGVNYTEVLSNANLSASGVNAEAAQTFSFAATSAVSAQLTVVAQQNFSGFQIGGGPSGFEVGLGEVRFGGMAVPEPATAALLLSGVVGVAAGRRRARRIG
ncbi:MAG: PEP-CTERM sorting domain-containing protein [Pseudomonadota bacterium]